MKRCVNIKHPEILSISEATGIHPLNIASAISVWQEENNTDEFPNKEYFNKPNKQDYYNKYGESYEVNWSKRTEEQSKLNSEFPGLKFLINGPFNGSAKFQPVVDSNYHQESNQGLKKTDKNLESKIVKFLESIGVTHINVSEIKDSEGNILDAVAVSKMLSKVIEVVEGKADITTLPEEAAHFFVSMLKDNQILEKMISDIDQYPVYNEVANSDFYKEQYKNDNRKLRIEAVGKQIVKSILLLQEEENKLLESKFKRFWNNIWDRIKSVFIKADEKAKKDLYISAGEDILSGNTEKLDINKVLKDESFFQSNEQQTKVVDNLDNKFKISLNEEAINSKTGKKGVYELIKDGVVTPIVNRVSDVVEAINKKRGFAERTDAEKAQDEVRRVIGTKGHSDINNIITRIVEKLNGVNQTAKVESLDEKNYHELEVFFTNFIKEFPAGTKFYPEKTIYSENKNEAGTLDLLAILPDGKAEIFDWKFVEFKNKDAQGKIVNKSVAWYKEENYNVQLTRYRQILRDNYSVKEFGKTRIIPISAVYKKDVLQSLAIGNKKIDGLDKPYLDPIPISGLSGVAEDISVERTGDEQLDKLLDVLLQQRRAILDKVEYDAEGKIKKAERLERINNSIKKLQVEGDIKSFLDDAIFELNYITNIGIKNLSNDDLVKAKELVNYYSDLKKFKILPDDQSLKYKDILSRVTLNAQDIYSKVYDEFESRVIKIANESNVVDPLKLQPETGLLAKLFNTISQNNHPIIKSFYRLVMNQKDKIYKDTEDLNKRIKTSLKDLEIWGKNKGISGTDIFNNILQFKDSKKTGKLINRWNPEYYSEKKDAISSKDYVWFSINTTFDSEKYKEYLDKNVKIWNDMYKNDVDGKYKIETRIEQYKSKYDPRHSNAALLNSSNRFIHPRETWRSKEWETLQSPENQPLKDFYDLFTSTINEFREHLPLDLNGNFIPNIKNDLLDQIVSNGFQSISGLGDSITQHLRAESDESVGMIDEITGEKVRAIPLFYTKELDAQTKSYDLGKVLSLFGSMAYNYKYMSEIESSAEMLKDVLSSQKQTITTSGGKELKSKITGKIAKYIGSSDTLDQFNDFMNFYIYGIKSSEKSSTFKFMGNSYSTEKTISSVMKYYVHKALAFNFISGSANFLGGQSNAFFEGVKGRFYNNSQYSKALGMMGVMNKKAFALIEYFDVSGSNTNFKKSNLLSVSSITKHMTLDKFHVLQQGGDYTVENGVLLALLQSHTIKDGKIVKINENSSDKSLFDIADISKDNIFIEGLSDVEFSKFRRKVKSLYSTMKGNSNVDDISTIKLTVLGQAIMMFRGWIPKMANERFGDLKHVGDLDVWEMGKYKSGFKHIMIGEWSEVEGKGVLSVTTGMIGNIITLLSSGGVLGIGANSIDFKSVTQKAIQLYNEEIVKNPNLTITQEEYIAVHKQNLKSAALELQLILSLTMILIALKGDDDDERDPNKKVALKLLKRYIQEVSFFIDPSSTGSILKKPIPILSLGTDITGFIRNLTTESIGRISGDEEMVKESKPLRYLNRLFPVTSAIENFWSMTDPDYNKNK